MVSSGRQTCYRQHSEIPVPMYSSTGTMQTFTPKKHGANPSDNFIYLHAQTMVTSLTHFRKDELSSRNPIIWVCHSLGGILTKRALLYSNDLKSAQHEDYRSLYVSTYGMVFLGTPHSGSDVAVWGTVIQAMSDAVIPKSFFHSEPVLLKTLKRDNETLQNINSHFLDIYQRFKIIMAHECHMTDLKAGKMLIVDPSSAGPQLPGVLYFGIEATHSNMCKFDSKNAPGYRTMTSAIKDWVLDAPSVIAVRWRVEDEERFARAQHEIAERMHSWGQSQSQQAILPRDNFRLQSEMSISSISEEQSLLQSPRVLLPAPGESPVEVQNTETEESSIKPTSNDQTSLRGPITVKPALFRPNTHFKGREPELKLLHKMLTDRERRSTGTASVLIQSMPGGGKTQLARQYVFQHKRHHPGGIFWIRAKSVEELEEGYWDIAKATGLVEAEDLDIQLPDDTAIVVEAVRKWFNKTENWLLVLDGVHFDMPNLHTFIPFAKNTSIIYTSTEKAITNDYLFDNPKIIALDSLPLSDARDLLLEEIGKSQPYNADDLDRATELVGLMDRLPLMIHVAGSHLKATKEPLATYLRSFKKRPRAGHLQAYMEVQRQLQDRGFSAALNLMYILAFFGQHVPVELLATGIQALDRSTPVKSRDAESGRNSLSQSVRILISFALIDRNICDETTSGGSSSDRSVDMARDNVDVLHLHGIVQAFFVDTLADMKEADFWLEQAIRVLCRAFDNCESRINDSTTTGLPEDFRRFRMHGKRLLVHIDRFEKRSSDLAHWRSTLMSRLSTTEGIITELRQRVAEADSDAIGRGLITSVFDRLGSLSETDSDTPASGLGMIDYFDASDSSAIPPDASAVPVEFNPYHWHVNYSGEPPRRVLGSPTPSRFGHSLHSTRGDGQNSDSGVKSSLDLAEHRTIRKQSAKRYRDHIGAWRSTSDVVCDPRVTLSRETAKGHFDSSLTTTKVTSHRDAVKAGIKVIKQGLADIASDLSGDNIGSDAAQALDDIYKSSSAHPAQNHTSIAQVLNPSTTRPLFISGNSSYSNARIETNNDSSSVIPAFSYRLGGYSPPTSSYTAATMMRLQDGKWTATAEQPLSTLSSRLPVEDPDVVAETALAGSSETDHKPVSRLPGSQIDKTSAFAPSLAIQSTRASPPAPTEPFSAPLPIPDAPRIESSPVKGYSQSMPQVPMRGSGFASSFGTSTSGISTSRSSPTPVNPRQAYHWEASPSGPSATSAHPPPWTFGPSPSRMPGYTSQPMSRNTSHYSGRARIPDSELLAMPEHDERPPYPGMDPGMYQSSTQGSPGLQLMLHPQSRRPSLVETEPSPNIPILDEIDSMMYRRGLMTPSHTATSLDERGNRASGSWPRQEVATRPLPYPSSRNTAVSRSNSFLARFRGPRSSRGASHSVQPDTSGSQRRAVSAGGRLNHRVRGRLGSPLASPWATSRATSPAGGQQLQPDNTTSATANPVPIPGRSQSVSPGVRLSDGSFVEFGGGFGQETAGSMPRSFRRSSWRLRRGRQQEAREYEEDSETGNVPVVGLGIDQF